MKPLTRIWCSPSFKKKLWKLKAENPDKPLVKILDDLIEKKQPPKPKGAFWGKL